MTSLHTIRTRGAALVLALASIGVVTTQLTQAPAAQAAVAQQLTRYPYLTDVVTTFATVNWATDRSQTKGSVKYGVVGSNCATKTVSEWFPKSERGWAVALFDSGSAVGGAVAPRLVFWIYKRFGSWRPAFFITSSGTMRS